MNLKIAILKKGIGIERQNLCKQFNDQKLMKKMELNLMVVIEEKLILKHLLSFF